MLHELWLTGARQHHYFSFSPDFPEGLRAKLVPFAPSEAEVDAYDRDVRAFLAEVESEHDALILLSEQ
jgi:hypothetical protein